MQKSFSSYPHVRLRRLRQTDWCRRLVQENRLSPDNLILPLFVKEGSGEREPVASMPGVMRYSVDVLVDEVKEAAKLGIPAVALFPVTPSALKTKCGKEALNPDNLICRAISAVKHAVPEIGVIGDVALDPYTTHGHDGVLSYSGMRPDVDNDATLDILCRQAIILAKAGCDIVAPSDMMDGRIGAIRQTLESEGFKNTLILSYAAKYASAFYGPFRDAVGSGANIGKSDKKTYQMNPANAREAAREMRLDEAEGADMLMVKPGLPYLDILRLIKDNTTMPVFAYQVSGEYAMIKAAAAQQWIEEQSVMMESLLSFRRAGADAILTYYAKDAAKIIGG